MKRVPMFATEADLCAAFMADAKRHSWTPYPETAGWDILLVRNSDGCQIGIQAKLKLNAKVLCQAVAPEHPWADRGPDYRAVLVPDGENMELGVLAPYCAITVITMRAKTGYNRQDFYPELPKEDQRGWLTDPWHELLPQHRHVLPEYVPQVAAGMPAPIQLTDWKIRAIRLSILLEHTGYLTRADFRDKGVDIRRWISGQWITPSNGAFVAGPHFPRFRVGHPADWEAIAADTAKWSRQSPALNLLSGAA